MKIISVSRCTFFECFRYNGFFDNGTTAELALVKKKPKTKVAFFSLLTANIHDKKEHDYSHWLGKLENKTNIFRKSRITCGLTSFSSLK